MGSRRDLLGTLGAAILGGCMEGSSTDGAPSSDAGTSTQSGKPTTVRRSARWSSGPAMPDRRAQTTAVALDGRLYVLGGLTPGDDATRTVRVYDPADRSWTTAAPLPEALHHTAAAVHGGRIHVVGGYTGSFPGSTPRADHHVYDPSADGWRSAPPLSSPRGALVAAVVDGDLLAVGGARDGTLATVEAYDPDDGVWERRASLPEPREHLSAGVVGNRLVVAGGRQGFGSMLAGTVAYDPGEDAWERRTPMLTARAGIAGAVLAGLLVVFGGEEVGERVFGAVEAYDPRRDRWVVLPDLPTPRWGLGAATVDGRAYTVAGGATPSTDLTRALEVLEIARTEGLVARTEGAVSRTGAAVGQKGASDPSSGWLDPGSLPVDSPSRSRA